MNQQPLHSARTHAPVNLEQAMQNHVAPWIGERWDDGAPSNASKASLVQVRSDSRTPDDTPRCWLSCQFPFTDLQASLNADGMGLDVAEEATAEAALRAAICQLVDADRRKDDFLAILSHELRNSLAPIKNSLYILERTISGGEEACRALAVISRQVDQLSRLIDDLLDVTRISRNKLSLELQPLELNDLVLRTVEDFRPTFERAGLVLQFQPATVPLVVDADAHRIAQVLGNLLENAAKFTPMAGQVTVTLAYDEIGGRTVTQVVDTGIGFTNEAAQRIFDPFVQADAGVASGKAGLGLGLALVKGVIELHGGTVSAASAGLGRGSAFTIYLPLSAMDTNH